MPDGTTHPFDLAQSALDDLHRAGFYPEFGADVLAQVKEIATAVASPTPNVPDKRDLGWSSIDNDTSRDLDQIECAERISAGIRVQVAIADVAVTVEPGSPIWRHAAEQCQTIYTAVANFPLLPVELSTNLTSLNENGDRQALLMSFTVTPEGTLLEEEVSRAWVRNRAQLAYSRVGPWLEARGSMVADPVSLRSDSAPRRNGTGTSSSAEPSGKTLLAGWLAEQLRLQDQASQLLHQARLKAGALEFKRTEADPVVVDGHVVDLKAVQENRATDLIEDLMVTANGVMARALRAGGRSCLQRIVRTPARWDRIVALAADRGTELPNQPDPVALNAFLQAQHSSDSTHYPDLALAVIKLMGAGEYVLMRPEDEALGHFGLAAHDYMHATAPNRRFPDLLTQCILHAMLENAPPPFNDDELTAMAAHCNDADKAIRKIDRASEKRVAAVALAGSVGKLFDGVVTGASSKGVYVRVFQPPFEGRVVQGGADLDVGARVSVRLLHTDPARAYIDLALAQVASSSPNDPSAVWAQ